MDMRLKSQPSAVVNTIMYRPVASVKPYEFPLDDHGFRSGSAELSFNSAASSFKSSRSHRLGNARGQSSGRSASGRAEVARALLRQIYNTEVDPFPDTQD
jgi:hypothetical protein